MLIFLFVYWTNKSLNTVIGPKINNESINRINSVTEFDEKHSDSAKLKEYSYFLTCEIFEFVKKQTEFDPFMPNSVTELMLNFDSVLIRANYSKNSI